MFKQRMIQWVVALVFIISASSVSFIVSDTLVTHETPPQAISHHNTGGGG